MSGFEDARSVWDQIYNQGRDDFGPWLGAGQAGIDRLGFLLGLSGDSDAEGYGMFAKKFSMDDYQEDPGYQFRLKEGQKALERGQSARGNFMSPAAMKAMTAYNQDMGSQEYGNAYNRYNNDNNLIYDRLMGVSGQGLQAAGGLTNLGMGYAGNMSNLYMQQEALNQAKNSGGFGFGDLLGIGAQLGSAYLTGGGSFFG